MYLRLHVYVDPLQEEPLERRQVNHWKQSQKYLQLENLKYIFISKFQRYPHLENLPKFGPTFSYQVEVRQSKMENAGEGVFAVIILPFFAIQQK